MISTGNMRKYGSVIRAEYANLTQFALNFGASVLVMPITLAILLYIFRAIAPDGAQVGTYSALQLSLYYVGVAVTWQTVQSAGPALWQSWQDINSGDLMIYLSRPIDYLGLRYCRNLAPASVVMVLAFLIHAGVMLVLGSYSLLSSLQYLVALWLSFSTMFMFWYLAGAFTFWWERPFTFRDLVWNLIFLLSGSLIPVDLLHPTLKRASEFLPFKGIFYVPAGIFSGSLGGPEAWKLLGTQAIWLLCMTFVSKVVWQIGLRTYDGRGG